MKEEIAQTTFKVGDFVFNDFELCQIKGIEDGRIHDISTGHFRKGSWNMNDECFAISLRVKCISDEFKYWDKKLHKELPRNANFPDIHRWLCAKWAETCRNQDNDNCIQQAYEDLKRFCESFLNQAKQTNNIHIDGIPFLRQ